MENPRNQNGIGTKELLVVSFGTSCGQTRRRTICAIEEDLERSFPDFSVRRCFTGKKIRRLIAAQDGITVDDLPQALERAAACGVQELAVQPTYLADGMENSQLKAVLAQYSHAFRSVAMGKPILSEEEDFRRVIAAIAEDTAGFDDGQTAICFLGHGTAGAANGIYPKLQSMLHDSGCFNYFVGTVKASPTAQDVLAEVEKGSFRRVVLQPLMIVAGGHAAMDMAGSGKGSWKSVFTHAGYDVICVLRGLGELPAIRRILVEHAQKAVERLG